MRARLVSQLCKHFAALPPDDRSVWRSSMVLYVFQPAIKYGVQWGIDDAVEVLKAYRARVVWPDNVDDLLRALEATLATRAPSSELTELLRWWRRNFSASYRQNEIALIARIDRLIERGPCTPINRKTPKTPLAAVRLLRDVARDAWATMNGGRTVSMPCPIPEDVLDAITPEEAWKALTGISEELMGKYASRPDHVGRYVANRKGCEPFQSLAPEFCAALRRLFLRVAEQSDQTLHDWCVDIIRPWHGPHPLQFERVVEALWLEGVQRPKLFAAYRAHFERENASTDCPKWGDSFEPIEEEADRGAFPFALPGDAWSDAANGQIASLPKSKQRAWKALFDHCGWTDWSTPPKGWAATARERFDEVPHALPLLSGWLRLVGARGARKPNAIMGWPPDSRIIRFGNARLLRGLIWAALHRADSEFAGVLARAAVACDARVLRLGPMCVIVRNAAINVLAEMPPETGGPYLAVVDSLVKYKAAKSRSAEAVAATARSLSLSIEDFVETMVPDYGPVAFEGAPRELNGRTFRCVLGGPCTPVIEAREEDGTWASLKAPSDELAEERDQIETLLRARRARLERALATPRTWTQAEWRDRYGDHPLLAGLGRSLIWRIGEHSAMWNGREWTGPDGAPVRPAAEVCLWHPCLASLDEVLSWRRALEGRELRQPFKQAHREVYLLTDAERATGTYSNRFAAHILHGRQMNALVRERGWDGRPWDEFGSDLAPCQLRVPHHGLIAQFDVGMLTEDEQTEGALLGSDGVVFKRDTDGAAVALTDVPPIVFSEVMRDVDFFVGVSSLGHDPNWHDGGPGNRFRAYWWETSFAELGAAGECRRDVLSRLIPRLAIADRCSLAGRFLTVRGNLRVYKIHLGSGNILMEPNDEYLCIVPKRDGGIGSARDRARQRDDIVLPFEGDRTLSLIISKAFLLAADDAIQDSSIVRQITRKSRGR